MRRPAPRVALAAMAIAIAIVTVLAVSMSDEQHTAEGSVLETTTPGGAAAQVKSPATAVKYVHAKGYPSFSKSPTGDFSRRRTQLAKQDAVGRQFDKMFAKYFNNPSIDLEDKLTASPASKADSQTVVGTMGAPATKTVEVIKELTRVHTPPKPTTDGKPPVVDVINGKNYEVKKVIKVQETVAPSLTPSKPATVQPPAAAVQETPSPPAWEACETCVAQFKVAGGCVQWKAGADVSSLVSPGCDVCASAAAKACGMEPEGGTVLHGKVAPTVPTPPVNKVVKKLPLPKTVVKAVKPAIPSEPAKSVQKIPPVTVPTVEPVHTASEEPQVESPVMMPPMSIHKEPVAHTKKPQLVPPPVKPKPLAPVTDEPKMGKVERSHVTSPITLPAHSTKKRSSRAMKALEKEIKEYNPKALADMKTAVKARGQKKIKEEEKKEKKETGYTVHVPTDNGIFGSVPKDGVWTGGDSNYAQPDEPWRDDDKSWPPSTPLGGSTSEVLEQVQVSSDALKVAPWEGDADAAPWEEEAPQEEFVQFGSMPSEDNKKSDSEALSSAEHQASLLQSAAKQCASRKVQQEAVCKNAEMLAKNECKSADDADCDQKMDMVHKFCDRTSKVMLKACFDDWQAAKSGKEPNAKW